MYRLKPIEISLLVGILFALVWGVDTVKAQHELRDDLIRLHVVANSDTAEDQENKLLVRDAVLRYVRQLGEGAQRVRELEQRLTQELGTLEQLARDTLITAGCGMDVRVTLEPWDFPTKQYEGFALPAGEYTALRVVVGSGAGENWWCVAFPPLCVGVSTDTLEQAVQAGYFTPEEKALVTGESGEYIIRFKSIELLTQLRRELARLLS